MVESYREVCESAEGMCELFVRPMRTLWGPLKTTSIHSRSASLHRSIAQNSAGPPHSTPHTTHARPHPAERLLPDAADVLPKAPSCSAFDLVFGLLPTLLGAGVCCFFTTFDHLFYVAEQLMRAMTIRVTGPPPEHHIAPEDAEKQKIFTGPAVPAE